MSPGENVPVSRESAAFQEWAETHPRGSPEPYATRCPDDIDMSDLEQAFLAGIEWATFNVEI
jgi:hypothetical protein